MRKVFRVEVVADRIDNYSKLVFKNLDEDQRSEQRYIMATVCPNWEGYRPVYGDIGFAEIDYVSAGENYTTSSFESGQYKYTACYFINFIKEKIDNNSKEYKF